MSKVADILFVEDNYAEIELVKAIFEMENIEFNLHVVDDGDKAIDFLYNRGEYTDAPSPDLIFLDINLPSMTGHEILEKIKNDEKLKTKIVVMLSGSEAQNDIEKSLKLGAVGYVVKTLDTEKLVDTVDKIDGMDIVEIDGNKKLISEVA